ncbi:MAG: FkbM family methyltransferase [Nostoc sp.]
MNSSLIFNSNKPSNSSTPWHLLVLSGKTESGLETATDNLAEFLNQNLEINLSDLAYTLQVDCQGFNYRRILVCCDRQDAACTLATRDPKRVFTSSIPETNNQSVVFMFPGLGEQYVNMALQLYQFEPNFRKHIACCSELLKPHLGFDLRDVLYPNKEAKLEQTNNLASVMSSQKLDLRRMLQRDSTPVDVNAEKLNQTYIAQPGLFVIEYALAQMWMGWGIQPQALIGYSIGEYVAACIAGVLSLEEALTLVAKRGQLIQQLPNGAMLAVSLSEMELQPMLAKNLSLSAINGPELCVVAGSIESVAQLEQQLLTTEVGCRKLQTTHAFHSSMMEAIVEPFIELVKTFDLKAPKIPYISNVTGTWITAEEATDPSYWSRHLCQTVRFADGIETLWQVLHQILLEVGPGQTLGSMALQHPASTNVSERLVLSSLPNFYNQQSDLAFSLNTLAQLWLAGVSVNWSIYADRHCCKLHLPTYSFDEQSENNQDSITNVLPFQQESNQIAQQRQRLNLQNSYVAPKYDTEQKIADIWQKIFKIEQVGIDDNFFSLGGHSLVAIKIISQLSKVFQIKLPLSVIFTNPTIAELALIIEEQILPKTETINQENVGRLTPTISDVEITHKSINLLHYKLPNSRKIIHQNKAETDHFYEDIFEHKVYAKHGIQLHQGACIFDVGANIGLFTLFVDQECSQATIYAFEPSPPTFEILKTNTSLCQAKVKLFNCGLSNRTTKENFTFYPNSSGMSSFYGDKQEEKAVLKTIMLNQNKTGMTEMEQVMEYSEELLEERFKNQTFECQLNTLSEIIREENIAHIDLLKIDVQKSELDVLLGINQDDWKKIKQIVLEVHNEAERLSQVTALLQQHGYSVLVEQDNLYKGTNIYNLYAIQH